MMKLERTMKVLSLIDCDSHSKEAAKTQRVESLVALSIDDIHKFQLKAWEADGFAFEEGTRFACVEHFLSTFGKLFFPLPSLIR